MFTLALIYTRLWGDKYDNEDIDRAPVLMTLGCLAADYINYHLVYGILSLIVYLF